MAKEAVGQGLKVLLTLQLAAAGEHLPVLSVFVAISLRKFL